jgi:tetratricopeptide (TPR) repeat protein
MAKKIEPRKSEQAKKGSGLVTYKVPPLTGKGWLFTTNFYAQGAIIVLVALAFYINSAGNKYALDDDIIMKENMYVQKGVSGIGDILSNDAYKSYYQSMGVDQQLSGGRYRPLSIITFAIEQEIFGDCYGERLSEVRDSVFQLQRTGQTNIPSYFRLLNEKTALEKKVTLSGLEIAGTRHLFQVFWFALSMLVLLWFLRECVFRENTDIAFFTALLFTIHPIHTEVVANVKSRDEIFSLMFICLAFIFFFRYDAKKQVKDLLLGMGNFFLAMLSKEYAVTLIVLVPAGLMVLRKRKLSEVVMPVATIAGVLLVYYMIRHGALGDTRKDPNDPNQDPLNDPYMYATPIQKEFSILNRLDDYLWLLFLPYPLVSDYSYQHFPYSDAGDITAWISIIINLALAITTAWLFFRRHPMAFAGLFYFAFFMLINNVLFDVGATMGERLIYHSSLGFCMAIAWLLIKGLEKVNLNHKVAMAGISVVLIVPAFLETIQRNVEWKTDFTLFTADVKKHPNSALTNGNAGARYMDYGLPFLGRDTIIGKDTIRAYGRDTAKVHRYADSAIFYLKRATTLHDRYVNGYLNLGLCYFYKENYDLASQAWGNAHRYFPSNPILMTYEQMLIGRANERAAKKDFAAAAEFMRCAAVAVPSDSKVWADYAGASFMARDFATAKTAFLQAINLDTNLRRQLSQGYNAANNNDIILKAYQADSMNPDLSLRLARAYTGTEFFYPESRRLINKTLELRPGDKAAMKLSDSLQVLETKVKAPPAKK